MVRRCWYSSNGASVFFLAAAMCSQSCGGTGWSAAPTPTPTTARGTLSWKLQETALSPVVCENPQTSCSIPARSCCHWELKVVYPGTPPAERRVTGRYTWTKTQGNQVSRSSASVDWAVTSESVGAVLADAAPKSRWDDCDDADTLE